MLVALHAPGAVLMCASAFTLAGALALVITRPRDLNVAWFTGAAAAIALALGLLAAATLAG